MEEEYRAAKPKTKKTRLKHIKNVVTNWAREPAYQAAFKINK